MNDTGTGRRFLFVCTIGGHLTQLAELSQRLVRPGQDSELWVTHESAQSLSLLEGRNVQLLPYIDERDWKGVARTIPVAASLIRQEKPDFAISTGSAIALAFLPIARLLRPAKCKTYFIDSASMVSGRTRTGRALRWVPGVRVRTQSASNTDSNWLHVGSVFDGFRAIAPATPIEPKRLVVTIGTSTQFGFKDAIEKLARIIPDDVQVLWQTGSTDVDHLDIEATPWLPARELEDQMAQADVVISHAGCGSILAALRSGKRPFLIPRRADLNEINDDHQFQISAELSAKDLVAVADRDTMTWRDLVEASGWAVERTTSEFMLDPT